MVLGDASHQGALIDFAEQARIAAEHGVTDEAIAAHEAEIQREWEANVRAAADGGWPDIESYLDSQQGC